MTLDQLNKGNALIERKNKVTKLIEAIKKSKKTSDNKFYIVEVNGVTSNIVTDEMYKKILQVATDESARLNKAFEEL